MMRVTVLSLALGTAAASFATREANLREIDELNNAEPEGGAVFKVGERHLKVNHSPVFTAVHPPSTILSPRHNPSPAVWSPRHHRSHTSHITTLCTHGRDAA